jgi:hypothetical protein
MGDLTFVAPISQLSLIFRKPDPARKPTAASQLLAGKIYGRKFRKRTGDKHPLKVASKGDRLGTLKKAEFGMRFSSDYGNECWFTWIGRVGKFVKLKLSNGEA